MEFEPIDRHNEPETDEFEKLEFLPEQPVESTPEPDDTAEIDFTPESAVTDEPPVSFVPAESHESAVGDAMDDLTAADLDFGGNTPFELVGTSLFDDADLDDDLDSLDPDPLDDLEF